MVVGVVVSTSYLFVTICLGRCCRCPFVCRRAVVVVQLDLLDDHRVLDVLVQLDDTVLLVVLVRVDVPSSMKNSLVVVREVVLCSMLGSFQLVVILV